jgi:hypothetical protein
MLSYGQLEETNLLRPLESTLTALLVPVKTLLKSFGANDVRKTASGGSSSLSDDKPLWITGKEAKDSK